MGLTFADLLTIARRTGYPVVSAKSSRNAGVMGAVVGCVKHHTGTSWTAGGDYPTFTVVKEGRSGLYNSLSAFGLGKSGTIYVFNELVSWHAGVADWNGTTDVNGHYLGIEAESDGVAGHWTPQQVECYPRLVAEILRYVGRNPNTGNYDPRHAQVANPAGRKSDFSGMDLADHDRRVLAWFNNPSGAAAAPAGPAIVGGIRAAYDRPGVGSRLGAARDVERPCADGVGVYQMFAGGAIWWHPTYGAFPLWGNIGSRYQAVGAERSGLGYPTSAEMPAAGGGVWQTFARGIFVWHPAIGVSFYVAGAISTRYLAVGGSSHYLGYPITDEMDTGTANGPGKWSKFQQGIIVWSAPTGAFEVYGDIAEKYLADGGTEYAGYPVGPQFLEQRSGRWLQQFTRGYYIWAGSKHVFAVLDEVLAVYQALGAAWGPLGYPTGNAADGVQTFAGGTINVTEGEARVDLAGYHFATELGGT